MSQKLSAQVHALTAVRGGGPKIEQPEDSPWDGDSEPAVDGQTWVTC